MTSPPSPPAAGSPAHLGWRLLALLYDTLPALAIWFLGAAVMLALLFGRTVAPGSIEAWMELLWLWLLTGLYAVLSWRLGGETLGMRPWRLRITAVDGARATTGALCLRYAVATVSLLAGGLGFVWSLFDRQRRTWHDRASGTVMLRLER